MLLLGALQLACNGGVDEFSATLAVRIAGTGGGTVKIGQPSGLGDLNGINCSNNSGTCEVSQDLDGLDSDDVPGTITLKAVPDAGSTFAGWSGDCVPEPSRPLEAEIWVAEERGYTCTAMFNLVGPPPPPPAACTNPTKTWTGTVSDDWSMSGNWTPAGVPAQTDDVCVPGATPNQPRLTANAAVRKLVGLAGAHLSGMYDLDIHGDLDWAGTTPGNFGAVRLVGASGTVRGTMTPLTVVGNYTVTGRLTVATQLKIEPGRLTLDGHTVAVGQLEVGPINAPGTGQLVMTSPLDSLLTTGVFFNGGDHTGLLTAGLLRVGGNFDQRFGTTSFVASGTHRTVFTTGTHTVWMFSPQAHFGDLDVSAAGTVTLNFTGAVVQGQLIATPAVGVATPLLSTSGFYLLSVGGADITRLNLSRLRLIINGGNITAFRNVAFTNFQNVGGTRLEVRYPGLAAPFGFDNLTFADVPLAGGFYLAAYDTDATTPPLTISVTNSSPASGAPYVLTSTGAVVNW